MEPEIRYEHEKGHRHSLCKLSLVVDGKEVARANVLDLTMRLCGAWVRIGGVGVVVVQWQHRDKGYGSRLLQEAVAYMERERYSVSILFGIPDFYHRFGYIPVTPLYTVSVAVRDVERLPAKTTIRPARQDDYPALLDLYALVNASRSGAVQRNHAAYAPQDEAEWWWGHPSRILVAEEAAHPTGYAMLGGDPSSLSVKEIIVPAEYVPTAGTSLLVTLAQEALAQRREQIRLPLPPDEPLTGLIRSIGCKAEITYPANGGGMGRIVDLAALAEAITPGIAARVRTLPINERPGSVEFDCPETGRARLEFGAGSTLQIRLPQQQLLQLLMGYRGIDELWLEHGGAEVDDLATIRALFPAGYPHMWEHDHF